MTQTVYQAVLSSIESKFGHGQTFTPYKVQEDSSFYSVSSDSFTNAFNTLEKNKIIERVNPDELAYSNWSIQYRLLEKEQTHVKFEIDNLIDLVSKDPRNKVEQIVSEVPAKVKEQTEKGSILNEIANVANSLNQLYSKVEKLETPNNFDVSKISTEDLLKEVAKRMSNGS